MKKLHKLQSWHTVRNVFFPKNKLKKNVFIIGYFYEKAPFAIRPQIEIFGEFRLDIICAVLFGETAITEPQTNYAEILGSATLTT